MAKPATKNQGVTVWLGTKAADGDTDTYVQIKRCRMVGEIGVDAPIIDASALEDNFKEKLKGIPDAGEIDFEFRRVYSDTGQNNLKTAAEDPDDEPYNMRVRLPGAGASGANVQFQFKALIGNFKDGIGEVDKLIEAKAKAAVTGGITQGTYT